MSGSMLEALRRAGLVDEAAVKRAAEARRLRERAAELLRLQREQVADVEREMAEGSEDDERA